MAVVKKASIELQEFTDRVFAYYALVSKYNLHK